MLPFDSLHKRMLKILANAVTDNAKDFSGQGISMVRPNCRVVVKNHSGVS